MSLTRNFHQALKRLELLAVKADFQDTFTRNEASVTSVNSLINSYFFRDKVMPEQIIRLKLRNTIKSPSHSRF